MRTWRHACRTHANGAAAADILAQRTGKIEDVLQWKRRLRASAVRLKEWSRTRKRSNIASISHRWISISTKSTRSNSARLHFGFHTDRQWVCHGLAQRCLDAAGHRFVYRRSGAGGADLAVDSRGAGVAGVAAVSSIRRRFKCPVPEAIRIYSTWMLGSKVAKSRSFDSAEVRVAQDDRSVVVRLKRGTLMSFMRRKPANHSAKFHGTASPRPETQQSRCCYPCFNGFFIFISPRSYLQAACANSLRAGYLAVVCRHLCCRPDWLAVSPPLLDDVDASHAQAAQHILDSGNWITCQINGIRYIEKPPLPYWLVAISYKVFGENTFATHLPNSLAMLGLCWLSWLWASRAWGPRAGLYAGLGVLTSVGPFLYTRFIIPESILALFLLIALYALITGLERGESNRFYWAYACVALATLTKGLIAPVFFIGAAVPYLILTGQWRRWRKLRLFTGFWSSLRLRRRGTSFADLQS